MCVFLLLAIMVLFYLFQLPQGFSKHIFYRLQCVNSSGAVLINFFDFFFPQGKN